MRKLKEVKSVIFLTCFILGIAFLSIYSFEPASILADEDSAKKFSNSFKDYNIDIIEKERRLFIEESQDLYTASRGRTEGLGGNEQTTQTTNQAAAAAEARSVQAASEQPAAPAPAVSAPKPAPSPAPAVSAPKPAPATAPAKASVVTEAVQEAEPVKADSGYDYDLDLLARLITAEAQGEPYEAKVAVGAVVVNRVQSGSWPNTYKGVIYQNINGYYQFTPVVNGWIDKPAQPDCIKAAKAAMSGADPTNGAEFYYDDTTTNEWILSKPVSTRIGQMIFAF